MAGDAKNYQVTITHSFIDGLLNALTGGFILQLLQLLKSRYL
jgi:hypothetical protein